MKSEIKDIPIEQLEIDPTNIRKDLDLDPEFVESIADLGVLQMPVVRPRGRYRYGVVIGARRFAAAQSAGLKTLRCEVRKLSDTEAMVLSMSENRHRKDILVHRWVELIVRLYNRLSGTRAKRIKKIIEKTKLSGASVRDYLNMGGLSPLLRTMLKEPEKRSKPEKELVSKIAPVRSEEKPPIGEKTPEKPRMMGSALPLVSEGTMRVLARNDAFRKWDRKEPERALRVAIEAAEGGPHHVPKVIRAEKEREKEKKPVVRVPAAEFKGPPAPLRVQLGRPIMDALEKYVKDKDIISPEIAVKIIVRDFLTKEGYLG